MYDSVDTQKGKYKIFQKESQTVQINSDEAQVIVSVPQMLPNFLNISMNETQDMSYQIRNVRFQNDFDNILVGDCVYIKVELGWAPFNSPDGLEPDFEAVVGAGCQDAYAIKLNLSRTANQTRAIGQEGEQYFTIGAPLPQGNKCLTANELVDTINEQIQREAFSLVEQQQIEVFSYLPVPHQNFVCFAMNATFFYNQTTGRMTLNSSVPTSDMFTPYTEYDAADTHLSNAQTLYTGSRSNGYTISTMQVTLFTDPSKPEYDQKRIARLFGMGKYTLGEWDGSVTAVPIGFKTFTLTPQDYYAAFTNYYLTVYRDLVPTFPTIVADRSANQKAFVRKYTQLLWSYGQYVGNFPPPIGAMVSLDSAKINANRYDQIYIHTSLNTNYWDYKGNKQDLLDIVPVETSLLELGSEHRHITRIYQSKDPNPRTFTISFTDEDGHPIKFNSNYQLALSFFYTQ